MTLLIGSFEDSYEEMEHEMKLMERLNKSCTMAVVFALIAPLHACGERVDCLNDEVFVEFYIKLEACNTAWRQKGWCIKLWNDLFWKSNLNSHQAEDHFKSMMGQAVLHRATKDEEDFELAKKERVLRSLFFLTDSDGSGWVNFQEFKSRS